MDQMSGDHTQVSDVRHDMHGSDVRHDMHGSDVRTSLFNLIYTSLGGLSTIFQKTPNQIPMYIHSPSENWEVWPA